MSEASTGGLYDTWLKSGRLSAVGYALMASVPGAMLINTPVFRLHEKLALRPEVRLLDVGCGRGSLLNILASRAQFEAPAVGVDVSREMLSLAQRDRAADPGRPPLDLARAAATSLPFADASFDIVLSSYVVKHVADNDLPAFFSELLRVLRPSGVAVIWEFAPTRSPLLDRWNRWVLGQGGFELHLRGRLTLAAHALEVGFQWVDDAGLQPFLVPPIPRISLVMGKADAAVTDDLEAATSAGPAAAAPSRESWRSRTGPGRAAETPPGSRPT